MYEKVRSLDNWQTIRLGEQFCEINSLENYYPFQQNARPYRLIITRQQRWDGQGNLFSGDSFIYRAILTNDYESSQQSIVAFYNQRGGSERNFDELNNDFGWNHLPFSFLEENTAFMLVSAMCKNLFHFLMSQYSKCLNWLKPHQRLKKFIFCFITVVGRWIYTGRRWIFRLYSPKDYKPDQLRQMFAG